MKSIAGRLLRPQLCSCTFGCRSREEMRERHGDPDQFLDALTHAFKDGDISFGEAERANIRYRAEWREAPERTAVDKS
jgi:hypothetical protein